MGWFVGFFLSQLKTGCADPSLPPLPASGWRGGNEGLVERTSFDGTKTKKLQKLSLTWGAGNAGPGEKEGGEVRPSLLLPTQRKGRGCQELAVVVNFEILIVCRRPRGDLDQSLTHVQASCILSSRRPLNGHLGASRRKSAVSH
ncbi:hypothetical protein GWI33_016423 [Rhynchophorus ferrugineus]|uniref:Uncharacterized protein n=1 Tax=Rhynchophorus ferrugineus TaxID=354439 RepID=A0A834IB71_RHYFE|nr:hypothetical protein GWI33_016423 [Rhynchophorus ferrugineus]